MQQFKSSSSFAARTLLAAGLAVLAAAPIANAQVRGVGDIKFEFNAPSRAGNMRVQFFDFSGSDFVTFARLNIAIPYDATKTADQNLVIKRDTIRNAIQPTFANYADATDPIIQGGVRATAFANNNANANVGFRGFNMTNIPFDVQRDVTNPNAVDRIMWSVTMTAGNTGELIDKIINRAPLRVDPLGGKCGHSRISFENSNFNPLTADGQPAQWHAGIVVNDLELGATVGVSDLPLRMDGTPDTSGNAIARALFQRLPSSIASFATATDPADGNALKFDFLDSPSIVECGVTFGTTSDSEGVFGTYALPTPGSLFLLGAGLLGVSRRRR